MPMPIYLIKGTLDLTLLCLTKINKVLLIPFSIIISIS
ncbi:hypothetical protein BGAPBR_K0005 (plasmid) [Borreliella garinii PBr]|uniref:Uncharacterized protein n=1 Tax=Borreliella garinii PBr TaxID=498743 RepID=B8F0N8_BORGR|nr:hypothetical protein BGAPBR_K0005 [Borreliella garinii PBr]